MIYDDEYDEFCCPTYGIVTRWLPSQQKKDQRVPSGEKKSDLFEQQVDWNKSVIEYNVSNVYNIGDLIRHHKFGIGVVLSKDCGELNSGKMKVCFRDNKTVTLVFGKPEKVKLALVEPKTSKKPKKPRKKHNFSANAEVCVIKNSNKRTP